MNKGNPLTKEEWKVCPECKETIAKWSTMAEDRIHSKHCYVKIKHGVSDINNCFQGSVITID